MVCTVARWATLEDFKDATDLTWLSDLNNLVRRTPKKLLPLLVNHKVRYIRWVVKRRLELKEFSVSTYFIEAHDI